MIQCIWTVYVQTVAQYAPETLTCSSLYGECNPGYISRFTRFGTFALVPVLEENIKNNIRSAGGTPLDSGRFRQAHNIRKKRCADKYCRIDC